MSKDKTFQEKLKSMFRKKEPIVTQPNREFILTNEILHDLGKDSPTNVRVKTMKELTVHLSMLETNGVEKLWSCIQDMFLREYPTDVRHATFNFLQNIIKNQFDRIYVMRAQFFRFIKHHDNQLDIAPRVDLLSALTNDGKEVEHFEEEIGPFLLNWFTDVTKAGKLNEFLKILDNVIKFNSPHLDEVTMTGFVKNVCVLCCNTNQYPIVIMCLQILGTVVAYSILPPESLSQFVGTLCRTVNIKCYCAPSWKTMKNLLGTHLGHSTLYAMCQFLQEPSLKTQAGLFRGCVFYIHMALWDINAMQNLCCPPSSVLPSVLQAVKCNHASVSVEVIIGIQKLINKQGLELLEPTWDIILEIILHVIKQIKLAPNEVPNNITMATLHEILNTIENLIEVGNYKGSLNQFFDVVHECHKERPETSVLKLIKFKSNRIRPTESAWLHNLYNLLTDFFKDERTNVRLKVLSVLEDIIQLYGKVWQYEDEIINHIVIPHMQNIANDDNVVVRAEVAKLLVDLCKDYNSNVCIELLEIIEKLLLRPVEKNSGQQSDDPEFDDIIVLVPGLVQLLSRKIHRLPSSHAIQIYKMFVDFLERNLLKSSFKEFNQSRIMIFDCLLNLRADSLCRVGLHDPDVKPMKFSPYLCASYKTADPIVTSPPTTSPTQVPLCKITHLPMESAFKLFLKYLELEKDWEIVKSILEKLPDMLMNKAIILTKSGNPDLNCLVQVLCAMLQNKALNLVEGVNPKVKRLEFQTTVVRVLVALSCYGTNLDPLYQQLLINTIIRTTGVDPRCSRQSINSLTICMVDMRETMMKLLPDVLLRLSKISASIYIAMPVLEFLSTLSQLPTVFANFVGDQYMAVFAIALPYTNPFKYDNYIVSLAYHVISVWFLKCRLPFRKDFVKFIVSGLQTNVMVPFQELNQFKLSLSTMNQDSSDRKRSSSLTEQGSRRRLKTDSTNKSTFIQATPRDKTVLTFYEELNETCIDLMARYTYSPCSALPKRLPTAEFLLNGGISKSWMLGNKLITITTSGCTEKVLKHGVCDKCWSLCSSHNNSKIAGYARSNSGNEEKESFLTRQSSTDKSEEGKKYDAASLAKMIGEEKKDPPICACWCQGWAEILIRRPTGNVSWVMKVQNTVSFKQHIYEFPLNEMATLYMPELHFEPSSAISIEEQEETEDADEPMAGPSIPRPLSVPGSPTKQSLSRQSSRDSGEDELEFVYDDGTRSRNPVRRSNSSPEMANWKNPFVHQKQERDNDSENPDEENTKKKKDVRVSCEAIPEEISGLGTSPPTGNTEAAKPPPEQPQSQHQHPSLLTCYSYPGSSPPGESNIAPKPYKTVPPSPNQITSQTQPPFLSKNESQDNNVLDRPNNLPNLANLAPLSSKPPQSPTQTSPRLQRHSDKDRDGSPHIQKSSSSSKLEKHRKSGGSEPSLAEKRDRLHTISVMSTSTRTPPKKIPKEILKSGLNPSFVFLQLYHTACFGSTAEVPLYVPPTTVIDRAITVLDRMYPYEVHKIGVLYVNEGQNDKEADILRNTSGCIRYMQFLQNLGTMIRLADVHPKDIYLGGVDTGGTDGKYMYTHQDDLVMVAFHVATLMPNKDSDPNGYYKKAHVGNDNVVIIYNNSGQEYDINTFKTQVTLAYIIVEPLDYGCNKVEVKVKSDLLKIIGSNEVISVSDQSVSILVRTLAVHADLTANVLNSLRSHATDPYVSNWLERLRKLKNLREKVLQELQKGKEPTQKGYSEEKSAVEDFTDFT